MNFSKARGRSSNGTRNDTSRRSLSRSSLFSCSLGALKTSCFGALEMTFSALLMFSAFSVVVKAITFPSSSVHTRSIGTGRALVTAVSNRVSSRRVMDRCIVERKRRSESPNKERASSFLFKAVFYFWDVERGWKKGCAKRELNNTATPVQIRRGKDQNNAFLCAVLHWSWQTKSWK